MSRREDPWTALGEFIRHQRRQAQLSLRQLAERARVSNPYLSQIERGIYHPSARVIKEIAKALGLPVEALYERIGLLEKNENRGDDAQSTGPGVEEAIRRDAALSAGQKDALIGVYRSFVGARGATGEIGKPPKA